MTTALNPIKRLLERPAFSGVVLMDCRIGDAYERSGILQDQDVAIVHYGDDTPRVPTLHRRRGPSTIAWLVVAIIVDAVNRCAVGAFTHICKEINVDIPSVAHSYAAIKIIGCLPVYWLAPRPHSFPNAICGTSFAPPSVTVENVVHGLSWHGGGSTATNKSIKGHCA